MRLMTIEPAKPSTYTRDIPVGRLRGEWGELLAFSCNDTLSPDRHQLITRVGKPQAMVVSTSWYRQARRVLPTPDAEVVGSEESRKQISGILTNVAEHNRHFVIRADRYDVVAMVPVPWHQRAVEALGGAGDAAAE